MLGCEWSSDVRAADLLQGSAGPQGPQGDTGSQGPQGPQGAKGLNWKAAWSAVDNYVADDAVSYNGSAWLAKRANSNVTPVEGKDWTVLAQKGDAGSQGAQGPVGATGPQGPPRAEGRRGGKGRRAPR